MKTSLTPWLTYSFREASNVSAIAKLKEFHNIANVKSYIDISDTYFDHVTKTANIYYYTICLNGDIIGELHIKLDDDATYLSV